MIKIEYVAPVDLTDADIRWIIIGCQEVKHEQLHSDELVLSAIKGDYGIFRILGDCEGILVTSPHEDRLFIILIAGSKLLRYANEIYEQLRLMAYGAGKTKLAGFVSRDGLVAFWEKRKRAKKVATLFVEELEHGRST